MLFGRVVVQICGDDLTSDTFTMNIPVGLFEKYGSKLSGRVEYPIASIIKATRLDD